MTFPSHAARECEHNICALTVLTHCLPLVMPRGRSGVTQEVAREENVERGCEVSEGLWLFL